MNKKDNRIVRIKFEDKEELETVISDLIFMRETSNSYLTETEKMLMQLQKHYEDMKTINKEENKKQTKYINKIIRCKNGWIVYNAFDERIDVFKGNNTEFEELIEKDVLDIWNKIKKGEIKLYESN
jgi:hypothetical protein